VARRFSTPGELDASALIRERGSRSRAAKRPSPMAQKFGGGRAILR